MQTEIVLKINGCDVHVSVIVIKQSNELELSIKDQLEQIIPSIIDDSLYGSSYKYSSLLIIEEYGVYTLQYVKGAIYVHFIIDNKNNITDTFDPMSITAKTITDTASVLKQRGYEIGTIKDMLSTLFNRTSEQIDQYLE
jgi:hypothetical protein